jgi:hypothetical protein
MADTAELQIDRGESSFSVTRPVSADLAGEDGRPSLSTSRDRLAPAPPPAAKEAAPAAPVASDPPAVDLDAPVREIESRLAQLEEQPPRALPAAPTPPGPKPDRHSFMDPEAFEAALIDWGGKDRQWRVEQHQYDTAKQQLDQHQASLNQTQFALYQSRRQRAMARHPDFVQLTERQDLPVTQAMVHAVVKLPDGAELMYWLAQPENKPEAERLARMDPSAVFLEMGRLAGKRAAVKPATAQRQPGNERRLGLVGRFQDENHLVVLQRQPLREGALLLPGKGVFQIISGMQWPVQILLIRRHLGKARVLVGHEAQEEGAPFSHGACPGKPQLLDQPVLQGLVRRLVPSEHHAATTKLP